MIRKINKVGTGTLTVSLPSKWAKNIGLKAGDEIEIEEKGGTLLINSYTKSRLSAITINIRNNEAIRSIIGVLYRIGYDEININLESKIELAELNEILSFFIGMEIKEFSEKLVVIKNIAPIDIKEYDFFINKIFITNKAIIDELITYFKGGEADLKNIEEMRKGSLKSREYCMRAINKLSFSEKMIGETYAFLLLLEKISGSLWHIEQFISNNKVEKSATTVKLLEFLKEMVTKFHSIFTKKDYERGINDVLNDRFVVIDEWFKGDKMVRLFKQKDVNPVVLALILTVRMNIASAMSRFLTTAIKLE